MATTTGLPAYIQRWITPSPKQLESVIACRQKQKAVNAASTATTSNTPTPAFAANYIGIIRKDCVLENEKHMIGKEVHNVTRTTQPQNRIQGLKISPSIFKTEKVQICVYFLSEQLAAELNIRKRMRYRKNKKQEANINESRNNMVEPMEVDPSRQQMCGKIRISPGWIPYDPHSQIGTGKLKYHKCAWFSFPRNHPLEQIRSSKLESAPTKLFRMMLSRPFWGKYPIPIDDLVECCQSEVLDEIMTKVVKFHRQAKNLHLILKTCLSKWVWKEQKKLAWKNKAQNGQMPCVDLTKTYVSANEDTLIESGQSGKRKAENNLESLEQKTFKRARLGNNSSPAALVTFENLNLSSTNFKLSPTIPTNPSEDIQRRALRFRKLQGKMSQNCVMATVAQMLHESSFSMFLGSRSNVRKFLKFIRRAIFLGGTKSSLQLWQLMYGLNVEHCKWLDCVQHPKVKNCLLAKVVTWIFHEYVIVMLRSSFYVTESSSSRNQLEFYLRNTWKGVTDSMHYHMLKMGKMKVVSKNSEQPEVGQNATLRFVPKSNNNLRPIVSYHKNYKQTMKTESGKLLLAYMSSKIAPHGVIDPVHLQNRWQKFLREWNEKQRPTLYFLRSDIRDAYPSVKISKLKAILDSMEIPNGLQVRTYTRPKRGNRLAQKVLLAATNERNQDPLYIQNRPWFSYKISPSPFWKTFDVGTALSSVKSTLSEPVVKIGKHKYILELGLPQGWQLSQHLCNIYYGTMDRHHFSEFLDVRGEFFIRNVDDYFFITTDPQRVASLRHKMENGIEEFNCSINSEKSWSNLYISSNECVDDLRNSEVKFYGWKFSLATGHVSRDFESYKGLDTCSTLSFVMNHNVSPELFITNRLLSITPLRLHALLFNSNFNCQPSIWRNVFDGALMVSFRFYAMCRVLYPNINVLLSEDKEVTGKLYAGLVRCAHLIARTVINLQSQAVKERKALFACEGAASPICDAQPMNKKRNKFLQTTEVTERITTEPELLLVIFHAFVLKLSKHGTIFKKILLPRLLRKKSHSSRNIGKEKTNKILTAVGINLPTAFAQIKK